MVSIREHFCPSGCQLSLPCGLAITIHLTQWIKKYNHLQSTYRQFYRLISSTRWVKTKFSHLISRRGNYLKFIPRSSYCNKRNLIKTSHSGEPYLHNVKGLTTRRIFSVTSEPVRIYGVEIGKIHYLPEYIYTVRGICDW